MRIAVFHDLAARGHALDLFVPAQLLLARIPDLVDLAVVVQRVDGIAHPADIGPGDPRLN